MSFLDALFLSSCFLLLYADNFSLCPQLHVNIFPSPWPFSSSLLWQFGHLAFVVCEINFLVLHSLSSHTSIFPLLPFTSNMNLPQFGHLFLVKLSCLNLFSLFLISFTILLSALSTWLYVAGTIFFNVSLLLSFFSLYHITP